MGVEYEAGYFFCGGSVELLDSVLVSVLGDGCAGVTEPVGDDFYVDAGCEHGGGVGVSGVVEPDFGQAGMADRPGEVFGDVFGVEGLA